MAKVIFEDDEMRQMVEEMRSLVNEGREEGSTTDPLYSDEKIKQAIQHAADHSMEVLVKCPDEYLAGGLGLNLVRAFDKALIG